MNHLEVWEMERASEDGSTEDRRWMRWVNKVEKLLGHDVDGDGHKDGFCIDWMRDAFMAGATPYEHVEEIRANPLYDGTFHD